MTNLISVQEAFNALQNGKEVLCSKLFEDDFKPLENYPATIFAMSGYEFCIKIELMELAGFKFTKPLTPHDVKEEQEIFIVMPMRILRTKFDAENNEILCSVINGFAQADAENAELQLKAIGATFGHVIDEVEIKDGFNDKPKKQRGKKEAQVKSEPPVVVEKSSEVIAVVAQPTIVITEQTNVTTSEDSLVHAEDIPENIKAALDTAVVITEQPYVSSSEDFLTQPTIEQEKNNEYKQTLDTLLQRVSESKTPAEVNAVYRYTRTWSDKQMEPLLLATHKRLEELEKSKVSAAEPPSLMVQIQTAPDLTTLDALEIDVAARDPQIQPKLMGYVRKRRAELESLSNEPDYLLEEPF